MTTRRRMRGRSASGPSQPGSSNSAHSSSPRRSSCIALPCTASTRAPSKSALTVSGVATWVIVRWLRPVPALVLRRVAGPGRCPTTRSRRRSPGRGGRRPPIPGPAGRRSGRGRRRARSRPRGAGWPGRSGGSTRNVAVARDLPPKVRGPTGVAGAVVEASEGHYMGRFPRLIWAGPTPPALSHRLYHLRAGATDARPRDHRVPRSRVGWQHTYHVSADYGAGRRARSGRVGSSRRAAAGRRVGAGSQARKHDEMEAMAPRNTPEWAA